MVVGQRNAAAVVAGGAQSTDMQMVINASITRWPTRMRGSTPRNYEVPFARPDAHELVMEMQFKG